MVFHILIHFLLDEKNIYYFYLSVFIVHDISLIVETDDQQGIYKLVKKIKCLLLKLTVNFIDIYLKLKCVRLKIKYD